MITIETVLEDFNYQLSLACFDPTKHLAEREEQYIDVFMPDDIMIVRENKEGWWKERLQYKNASQLEKLKQDDSVVIGWLKTRRFTDNGGWELD